jgi:hypothetical protein
MDEIMSDEQRKSTKRLQYLSAEKDFEIGKVRKLRILRGNASRVLWCHGQVHCRSDDGIHGKLADGDGILCADCKFLNGIEVKGKRVYCSLRCDLYAEHSDKTMEYKLSIPHRAQMNLTKYVRGLLDMGVDIPDVITEVERVVDSDGLYNYIFSLAEEKVEDSGQDAFSADERQNAMKLRDQIRQAGEQMPVDEFADTLPYMPGLETISHERALALAESLASHGVIK